ncbi:hypothetical protein Tco_1277470 [Tanacetum coccineum]
MKMGKEHMKDPVPHDFPIVQLYVPPMPFLGHLKQQRGKTRETICMIGIPKKTHNKTKVDEGYMDDGWDIMVKDVERHKQILTPTVHLLPNLKPVVQPCMPLSPLCDEVNAARKKEHDNDIPLQDGVMQPLTYQIVHITPPEDDYVEPTTSLILDKHLNEFREEFSDITRVDKRLDGNPINDVKELSEIIKTYDFETFIQKLLHRVSQLPNETSKKKGKRNLICDIVFPTQWQPYSLVVFIATLTRT